MTGWKVKDYSFIFWKDIKYILNLGNPYVDITTLKMFTVSST